MKLLLKSILLKKSINQVRLDLLNMRFAKAQKTNFSPSKYKKTKKILAKMLTQLNLPSNKK